MTLDTEMTTFELLRFLFLSIGWIPASHDLLLPTLTLNKNEI